jgi:hypothetical protein
VKPGGRSLAVCAALAFGASVAVAEEPARIQTDRPSVSNSTSTIPPGALQIEGGVDYSLTRVSGGPDERQFVLSAMLRAGLTDRLEVRLDGAPWVRLWGAENDTGFGDPTLGVKYRFLDAQEGSWWPSLGLLPFVKLPIARAPIGSERVDFGFTALASVDLPWQLGLDANVGLSAIGQSKRDAFLLQEVASASLSRQLGARWSTYVEVFYSSPAERGAPDIVGFDAGIQFFAMRRVALDAAAETSLGGSGPGYAVRAGVSVRFGR